MNDNDFVECGIHKLRSVPCKACAEDQAKDAKIAELEDTIATMQALVGEPMPTTPTITTTKSSDIQFTPPRYDQVYFDALAVMDKEWE